METLLGISNDKDLPFLISTALCYYLFTYIHPFYDGNGRTARFLTSYQLTQVLHYTVALRLPITIKKTETITPTCFRTLMTKTTAVT